MEADELESVAKELQATEAAMPLDLSMRKKRKTEPEAAVVPTVCAKAADGARSDENFVTLDLSRRPPSPPSERPVVQRASVLVRLPKAVAPATSVYQAPAVSPQIADHVSPLDHHAAAPDPAAYHSHVHVPEYNPFMAAAAAAAAVAATTTNVRPSLPLSLPPLPPPLSYLSHPPALQLQTAQSQCRYHHQQQQLELQQQQQLELRQRQQLQLRQRQQLQLQQHQQQQQQLQLQLQQHIQQQQHMTTYGGNPMMLDKMASPLYVATSSPSSTESNHFPFVNYDCLPRTAYNFGYPYYCGMLGTAGLGKDYGSSGGGGLSSDRSDCVSPESTTVDCHAAKTQRSSTDEQPDVDPEEVAAIYKQSDFLSFRQRYLENLGPPKNFEKMRRSVPGKRLLTSQQQSDHSYVLKRKKNNEAAKRSRDAKRQKYVENQISVMYLTKKVSEMKEIKRRLLLSM